MFIMVKEKPVLIEIDGKTGRKLLCCYFIACGTVFMGLKGAFDRLGS